MLMNDVQPTGAITLDDGTVVVRDVDGVAPAAQVPVAQML